MFSAELKCLRKSGICQKFLPETLEICWAEFVYSVQCESKKFPPKVFWHFFANGVEFLDQILHTYYTFLSALDYKFLSNYVQFWRSYAIVSATTQFTPYVQNVHHRPKRTLAFSDIFPKQLRIFGPNFTHLLSVPIYARVQICIRLSATVTKLCHIKRHHPACVSTNSGHFEHEQLSI